MWQRKIKFQHFVPCLVLSHRDADRIPHIVVGCQFVRSRKVKKSFGGRLKELRGNLSQDDFALKIGEPNFSGLVLIANSCGVSADWLLGLTDERAPGAAVTTDARIAELEKKVIRLEGENSALQKALAIVGGHPARPVKTGGAPAAKIA